ncbi:MAG: cytidine deaminase [bacterium]
MNNPTQKTQIINNHELLQCAKKTMHNAFSPYSKFKVGAALLTKDGKVFTGCNIENSSYGACLCAERVAVVKAISEGYTKFDRIAIVGSHNDFTYPCGICRQFMSEFGLDLKIIVENGKETREHLLKELLPEAFVSFVPESE